MSALRPQTALACLLCLAMVLTTFATAGVTPALAVSPDVDVQVTLDLETEVATRGAVVPIVVSMTGTDTVMLTLTGPEYHAQARLVDTDGDGRVRMLVNSYTAGRGDESQTYRAVDADTVHVVSRLTPARTTPLPAGEYEVVATAGTARDDALLRLDPFSFGSATVVAAPRGPFPADTGALDVTATETATVAEEDWVVLRFDAPGLSGVVDDESPPGMSLVAADPSTPKAVSMHTVTTVVGDAESGTLRRVTVNYDRGVDDRPQSLLAGTQATLVGVDTDADGVLDARLDDHLVSVVSHSSGRYIFHFDGRHRLHAGDALVVQYRVINPNVTGYDGVSVRLNDAPLQRGTVAYGPAGDGTLGNGVILSLVRLGAGNGDGTEVSLAQARVSIDAETLTVVTPAPALADGTETARYRATLGLADAHPYAADVNETSVVAEFDVVTRRATVSDTAADGRLLVEPRREMVSGTTSLAPGSRVVVAAARYDGPEPFLQVRFVTVNTDGEWRARFDFREASPGDEFTLAVYDVDRSRPAFVSELTDGEVSGAVVENDAHESR